MSRMLFVGVVLVSALFGGLGALAQQTQPAASASAQFDVVSIKPNTTPMTGTSTFSPIRTLPDGTTITTNVTIQILLQIPAPARQMVGLPDWTRTERYDITTKPPAGSTPAERAEMMRNMFVDRMKFAGHIEEREQNTFALVVVRADGRLGPELKPSTLDCTPRPPASGAAAGQAPASSPAPVTMPPPAADMQRCGMSMRNAAGAQTIASGGVTMEEIARSLSPAAGGLVNNRTGLEGRYALTLRFAPARLVIEATADAAPEIFTALQEQLGLKLQPEKTMVPVFVVDHIERPSEN